ncbi:MAG: DUF5667 domain-containing protein [bacterium]
MDNNRNHSDFKAEEYLIDKNLEGYLNTMKQPAPSALFTNQLKVRLWFTYQWLQLIKTIKGITNMQAATFFKTRKAIAALTAAGVILSGAGASWASTSSLPNQPLYAIKRINESVSYSLASKPEDKARVSLQHAKNRLHEVELLLKDKKASASVVKATLKDMNEETKTVLEFSKTLQPGTSLDALLTEIATAISEQKKEIAELIQQASNGTTNTDDTLVTPTGTVTNTTPVLIETTVIPTGTVQATAVTTETQVATVEATATAATTGTPVETTTAEATATVVTSVTPVVTATPTSVEQQLQDIIAALLASYKDVIQNAEEVKLQVKLKITDGQLQAKINLEIETKDGQEIEAHIKAIIDLTPAATATPGASATPVSGTPAAATATPVQTTPVATATPKKEHDEDEDEKKEKKEKNEEEKKKETEKKEVEKKKATPRVEPTKQSAPKPTRTRKED